MGQRLSDTSVELTWTAIPYTGDTGGYEVEYSEDSGGPYTPFTTTATKSDTSTTVINLTPDTTYFLRLRTLTDPHSANQNTVYSEYTDEVSATPTGFSDVDGDGMDDAWEQQIIDANPGDGIETIEDVLPDHDYDGDGLNNYDEFHNFVLNQSVSHQLNFHKYYY